MITHIKKRDDRIVPFTVDKIIQSIFQTTHSHQKNMDDYVCNLVRIILGHIDTMFPNNTLLEVEELQHIIEKVFIEEGFQSLLDTYKQYRNKRTQARERKSHLMHLMHDLTFKDAKHSDLKRENANINADTAMGTMLKYGSESAKQFYELYVLKPQHSIAHNNGDIHIHDLDFLTLTTTCCQIDIKKLFSGGFNTGYGFIREPNEIRSYSSLVCIALQANQNDQHGGQSIPNFDYGLALGVAKTFIKQLYTILDLNNVETKDSIYSCLKSYVIQNKSILGVEGLSFVDKQLSNVDLLLDKKFIITKAIEYTEKETFQAMEALVYNLNTMHSRAGAQIPFSSINYGTDTTPEGRMVTRNLLLAIENGLGNGETPIFPISIFKVKEGINFNVEDPNYDLFKLACRVSAKRLLPNFSFIDAPFNYAFYKPDFPETEVAYMGCRTRVIGNIYDPLREITFGRGNLSFTSVNLPRLAILAKGNIDDFFSRLDGMVELVFEQLLDRLEVQSSKKCKNFPFLMGQGIWIDSDQLNENDEIREVIKHGTLTIGFIGLAECLIALLGVHHGESEEAQNVGLKIIQFMREKVDNISQKTKLNFSLIATPAEGLAGRFVSIDRTFFGKLAGITDKDYYTNSFHVPVYYPISIYNKIRIEAPYHALTNGGHITYVEVDGDIRNNLEAFEDIIRTMKEMGIGYGSINHPVDRDPVCGYTGIIDDVCPQCGRRDGEGIDSRIVKNMKNFSTRYIH